MTDTKFTPGPWYATENGGDDPDERKLLVGKDDNYGDFTTVCDCRSKWLEDEVGGSEEANAHLIAAAPELYEFAEEHELFEANIILKADWSDALPKLTEAQWDWFMRLQAKRNAVLAKARGET